MIMIPTYNEIGNIPSFIERLLKLNLGADIVFVDDDSPDGTGKLLDEYAKKYNNIIVRHRPTKTGIGTAHQHGIEWAYNHNYTHLITMDGDFTHSPEDIPKLLQYSGDYDIVIGGRHAERERTLKDWTLWRKFLTFTGHQFTSKLLNLPYDATTAFRIYRIDIIPHTTFQLVKSKSYSFFFESLCILNENKFTIYDVPVVFPPRAAGSSKLKFQDMVQCLLVVLNLGWLRFVHNKSLYDQTIKQN
jgi:dolichol-phosphate mannosyltransferase